MESTGRLAIIEVKLAGNAESRRAVVAQVPSYAGYLQGLDPDQLESQVLGRPVLTAVHASDQQQVVGAEDFQKGLARSLAEGSFRLVIVPGGNAAGARWATGRPQPPDRPHDTALTARSRRKREDRLRCRAASRKWAAFR